MIPAQVDYVRPTTLRQALKVLSTTPGAKLLSGGHSLIPLLRFRFAQPEVLVDIGGLAELKGIEPKGRSVRIGAATTYRELLDSALLRERYPLLAEATVGIGDVQVRNAGTIGGGLAHADPAADMPAVMLALDATFHLRSPAARRAVPAREFFTGAFTTALAADEVLTDIVIPALPRGARTAYASFEQQASGYPLAAAAAVVTGVRKIGSCVLALTGVGDHAYLAESASRLVGTPGDEAAIAAVADGVTEGITVLTDLHAPAEYRAHLARVAARRALATALSH
jgi:carbon-monoxide dehydrogenase medium subunit